MNGWVAAMKTQVSLFAIFAVFYQLTLQHDSTYASKIERSPSLRSYDQQNKEHYRYEIKTFEVPVDHFSFSLKDTFKIRYLVNDTWAKETNAPIFFYTGNEGDIEAFARNTGFMFEIAPEFKALVIFAEHRYYGESLPYGNKSYADPQHLGYLTSLQAMEDYTDLIAYLRSNARYEKSPVILFGGSYGGMLSAWMRMKYPYIVQGAIASSAPILHFTGITACEAFPRIITSDFRAANEECSILIRRSWRVLAEVTSTDAGKKWVSDRWKLCKPLNTTDDVRDLRLFLITIYGNLAMANYPYEADFLVPLPANPISAVCEHLTDLSLTDMPLLTALQKAVNVYTNFTGKASCMRTDDAFPDLGASGWDYQACTEMIMPMCYDGVNDMFEPQPWDISQLNTMCNERYSVSPQPNLICERFGCHDLSMASNIVFSNGLLDPWSSGGVLRNLSATAVAILIPEGAHHLDLRGSNPNDPRSIIITRNYHRDSIKRWIAEYRQKEQRMSIF